ncbi:hypothetical protein GCM10010211_76360 [Streptomyces albospinus]|uniref:Uncharacterized protein n=1 Tax=Streptomyces albospinus TaxID=285515 RepID=A0ABQ2VLX1_9ACTN|nr:hypothetical protein GCM10010211_76360 [Streptomyces albospinus]
MKHSYKSLMARGALAALGIATIVVGGLSFMDPDPDVGSLITLSGLQVALTSVTRYAGWPEPPSRRSGNSAWAVRQQCLSAPLPTAH